MRRAGHRHEWRARTRAVVVQRARRQLLAGARFAGQQHRAGHAGRSHQRGAQAAHRIGVADQRVHRRHPLAQRAAKHPVFALQVRALQAVLDRIEDLRHPKRLEDEVRCTRAQSLDRGFEVGKRGDQNHFARKALFAQLAQPGDAVLARQRDVEDHQVEAVCLGQGVGFFGAGGQHHLATSALQCLAEEVAHALFVIDDQHGTALPAVAQAVGDRALGRGMDREVMAFGSLYPADDAAAPRNPPQVRAGQRCSITKPNRRVQAKHWTDVRPRGDSSRLMPARSRPR